MEYLKKIIIEKKCIGSSPKVEVVQYAENINIVFFYDGGEKQEYRTRIYNNFNDAFDFARKDMSI